jgi:two-component system OmpR family response regulator
MMQDNSRRRLLVVDDDRAERGRFDRLLTREGFSVEFAGDRGEALSKLSDGDYAVVILDLMKPRGGGLELLKEIRGAEPRMMRRIIVATAADNATVEQAGGLGVHSVVRKPFDVHQVVDAARSCACRT